MCCFHEMAGVIFAIFQYFAKKIDKKSEKNFLNFFFLYFVRRIFLRIKNYLQHQNSKVIQEFRFFWGPRTPRRTVGVQGPLGGGQNFKSAQTFFQQIFFVNPKNLKSGILTQEYPYDQLFGSQEVIVGSQSTHFFFFYLVRMVFPTLNQLYLAKY